jgi:hypothetical protein
LRLLDADDAAMSGTTIDDVVKRLSTPDTGRPEPPLLPSLASSPDDVEKACFRWMTVY